MDIRRFRAALRERTPARARILVWRAWRAIRRESPGLLMHYVGPATLQVDMPPGYEIRAWQPGDDECWVELLQASGAFGDWTAERLAIETRGLVRDAQFFAIRDGTLVAATGLLARPLAGKEALEVAWVVRHPAHAGRRLGTAVVVRALQAATALPGGRPVYLYTDDHRLTAIAIYLELGFVADLTSHRSYRRRWRAVLLSLALRGPRDESASTAEDGGGGVPEVSAGD